MQTTCNLHASQRWLVAAVLALLLAACDVQTTPTPARAPSATRSASTATRVTRVSVVEAEVVRVVDGDTIVVALDGQQERVRYIGVDTPETVDPNRPEECYGREASAENAWLVEGQVVELEQDVSERDRFGRLLRYVYVTGDDGERIFVNLALVANGFANVVTYPPDVRHADEFRAAERAARDAGLGLWGACE